MNKLKQRIENLFANKSPIDAVRDNPTEAGKILCEFCGWTETFDNNNESFYFYNDNGSLGAITAKNVISDKEMATVFKLQEVVIEECGAKEFGYNLFEIVFPKFVLEPGFDEIARLVSADARKRVTAMLLTIKEYLSK